MKKLISSLLFAFLATSLSAQLTWHPISVPTQANLHCISFGTNQVGYIGGSDSTLLKTMDGGKTWTRMAIVLTDNIGWHNITDINFVDAATGYMLDNNSIFRTTDGGASWVSEQPNQTNMCFKTGLFFLNDGNGFVGGSMCFQGATIGNKVNGIWDTVEVIGGWDASQQIHAFDFRNPQLGLAVGQQSTIFRTTDGGLSWDSVYASIDTLNLTDVAFLNDTLVYASYSNVGLEGAIVSYDGGLTWQRDFGLATFAYPGFDAALNVAGRPYLAGRVSWGNGGIIFNLTPTWWNYSLVPQRIHGLDMHSDSTVFAVGDSGYVAVNRLPSSIGFADYDHINIEVFPNPASDLITISLPESFIGETVLVYDMRGACVFKEEIKHGKQKVNIAPLATGAYILCFGDSQLQPIKLLVE
jgi:photosystem II stability/assembly factor-like uncharacterized protein